MRFLGFDISRSARVENVSISPAKSQKAISKIQKQTLYRVKQGIQEWSDAIDDAEDMFSPNNEELIRLYNELVRDPHLSALMDTMTYQVLSNQFNIEVNGEVDEDKTELFKTEWFEQFIKLVLQARYYGFSYLQFEAVVDDAFSDVTLVPRQYVEPMYKKLKRHPSDRSGIDLNSPQLSKWNMFIDGKCGLGLLSKAAPYVIFKREVMQFWAAYNEVFGQPTRIGKTDIYDNDRQSNMAKMLDEMSYAPWAVLHNDDSYDMIAASGVSGEKTYEQNIRLIDEQLSKLIAGQTMVLDNGSSRSQSETHERNMMAFINAMMRNIEYVVNGKLIPFMINLGFPLSEGDKFKWDQSESISVMEKADIIAKISPYYKLDTEYVEQTLDVKLAEVDEVEPEVEPDDEDEKDNPLTNMIDVANYYTEALNHMH